jgi:hypothetical protein
VPRTTRNTAVLTLLAAVLAGCASGSDVEPLGGETSTETAAPTESPDPDPTETEPEDPFAIPDEIDEDYAQAVIDELFAITSEALRLSVAANGQAGIPEAAQPLVAATHTGPRRTETIMDLQQAVTAANVDEVFFEPAEMGDERFEVFRMLRGEPECLVVTGKYDISQTARSPGDPSEFSVLSLTRADSNVDRNINPTPWVLLDLQKLTFDGEPASRKQVAGVALEDIIELFEESCGESS